MRLSSRCRAASGLPGRGGTLEGRLTPHVLAHHRPPDPHELANIETRDGGHGHGGCITQEAADLGHLACDPQGQVVNHIAREEEPVALDPPLGKPRGGEDEPLQIAELAGGVHQLADTHTDHAIRWRVPSQQIRPDCLQHGPGQRHLGELRARADGCSPDYGDQEALERRVVVVLDRHLVHTGLELLGRDPELADPRRLPFTKALLAFGAQERLGEAVLAGHGHGVGRRVHRNELSVGALLHRPKIGIRDDMGFPQGAVLLAESTACRRMWLVRWLLIGVCGHAAA